MNFKNLLTEISGNNVTIYRTCEEMPLWNFSKYLKTNDLKYFTKELKEAKGLEEVMISFFDEYVALSGSSEATERLRIMNEIMRLSNKYDTVKLAITGIYAYDVRLGEDILLGHIDILENFNYKIDRNKPLFEQIEKVNTRIEGIKTKIELLKPDSESQNEKEAQTIESQIITVTRILMLPFRIDQKNTTVSEWVEMQKQCVAIAEEQKKSKLNGK